MRLAEHDRPRDGWSFLHVPSPRGGSSSPLSWRDKAYKARRARAWWLLAVGFMVICSGYMMMTSTTATVMALTVMSAASSSAATAAAASSQSVAKSAPLDTGKSRSEHEASSLLNLQLIRDEILAETPWAESHGSDHRLYLGAGMLYYGFAYAFQARTIVVLGSGGGFVPRVLRQAQRDLAVAGRMEGGGGTGELYLVDAHLSSAGWGSTFYAENLDTVMRQRYPDIHYLFNTTDAAFEMLKDRGLAGSVDYLHVDADHSFEQSYRDFANYVQLLSPRGVVSFHDTCRDPDRKCRSGVPQTIDKIAAELDTWGLQLLDAHYLYRGIAVAIRKSSSVALDAPPDRRRNFCKYNAHRLSKSSAGFSMNKRVGTLDSLGDFYECNRKFKMSELVGGCPFGTTRDDGGRCTWCIPGMKGDGCREFRYSKLRMQQQQQESGPAGAPPTARKQQTHVLAAAWLAGQRSQHIMELGRSSGISVANVLQSTSPLLSSTVVDPFLESPVWSDDNASLPSTRHLPCKPSDVMLGGLYFDRFSKKLQDVDALVCLECGDQNIGLPSGGAPGLVGTLLSSFPHVKTLVVEGSRNAELLNELVRVDGALSRLGWKTESDLLLTDNLQSDSARSRRMVMLVRAL